MKDSQIFWYIARVSGFVAWALLAASVLWGVSLSTRAVKMTKLRTAKKLPATMADSHRFLSALAVLATGVHMAALVGDNYLHFGWKELFVPGASTWKPTAVALGVVAMWLLAAVQVTSLAQRHLKRRSWARIHRLAFVLFIAAEFHTMMAGTDVSHPAFVIANAVVLVLVLWFSVFRILSARSLGAEAMAAISGEAPTPRRTPRMAADQSAAR